MTDFIHDHFYTLDLLIGYGLPVLVFLLSRSPRRAFLWRLYWLGVAIGMVWEFPIFVLSAPGAEAPVLVFPRGLPVHLGWILVSHTLWDGGLFLVGVGLIHLLCRSPVLVRPRLPELLILVAWGQVQAPVVELGGLWNDAWAYRTDYWWNPAVFQVGDHGLPFLPQFMWLITPILFYFLALRIVRGPVRD